MIFNIRFLAELLQHIAIFFTLVYLFKYVMFPKIKIPLKIESILNGVLFALIAGIGMFIRIELGGGLYIDGRIIMVGISAAYVHPLSGIVTAILVCLFRLFMGGVGVPIGIIGICGGSIVGMLFYVRSKEKSKIYTIPTLLIFGLLLTLQAQVWIPILYPWEIAVKLLKKVSLIGFVSYPIGTLIIGIILNFLSKQNKIQKIREVENRDLVQSANSIVLKFDRHGIITFINSFGQRFFGFDETELIGKNIVGTIVPDVESTGRDLKQMIKDIIDNPEDYIANENENICKNGKRVWVSWSNKLISDSEGDLSELLCIGHDITKRIQLEEALKVQTTVLQENREQFKAVFDNTSDGILVAEFEIQRIVMANNSICEMLGYTQDELMGYSIFDIHPEEEKQAVAEAFEKHAKGEINVSEGFPLKRKDGSILYADIDTTPLDLGSTTLLIGIFRDTSEKRRLEQGMQIAQEVAKTGQWELDIVNNQLKWSKGVYDIFEMDPEHFGASYEAFLDAIHPEDRDMVNKAYANSLKTKEPYTIFHRLLMKDGRPKHVKEACYTEFDEVGNPLYSIGIIQDITEIKKAEEQLSAQKLMLRTILNSIQETAFLMTPEGYVLFANKTLAERMNTTIDRIVGHNILKLLPEKLAKSRMEVAQEVISTGKSQSFQDERDGRFLENMVYPFSSESVDQQGLAILSIDITNRINKEQELRKLWMAVEQSPSSIVITDPQGAIEYVNPGFCSTTGYTIEEATGENPRILKSDHHDDSFYRDMWATLTSGNVWRGEICNRKKNGALFWEQASISPVVNDEGTTTHYITVKDDITQKKELERLKEDFERIMRHDLKSPLTAIIGYPDLLLKSDLTIRQKKMVQYLQSAGQTMQQIIDSYLDMAKMEAGTYELNAVPLDISEILMTVLANLEPLASSKKIDFELTVNQQPASDDEPVSVIGEELLCYSLLSNLIKNAIEASPDDLEVRIDIVPMSTAVDIRISNQGVVSEKIRQRFFDKYTTTGKSEGTGLGTYSAKLMAEIQGGSITMQTSDEEGTTITVVLPALSQV